MTRTSLILGGARSGKSAHAEKIVLSYRLNPLYLASAQALDAEMSDRVARHKSARAGQGWTTIEEPRDIASIIATASPEQAILFDCATLWLTNHWMDGADLGTATRELAASIHDSRACVVVVSNELGQGNVALDGPTRKFNDAHGEMNQALARVCDHVALVVAGLPLVLKGSNPLAGQP